MEQHGCKMIEIVDSFYVLHNRLPEYQEITHAEDEHDLGPFYEKISESSYSIYFCLGPDEYYMYNSKRQEWNYYPHQNGFQKVITKIRKLFIVKNNNGAEGCIGLTGTTSDL